MLTYLTYACPLGKQRARHSHDAPAKLLGIDFFYLTDK